VQALKALHDIQLYSSRSVSRIQMQRFAKVTETVTVQLQVLTEWVGQLWGEVCDWVVHTG
jgi:hypothetical protein